MGLSVATSTVQMDTGFTSQPVASWKAAFSRPSSRAMLRREDNCLCGSMLGYAIPRQG